MEAAEYELMDAVEASMWWYRGMHGRIEDALQRSLPRPGRVLDAGCGTGGLLARLRQQFPQHRLVGVDVDPAACRRAAKKAAVPVVAASVNALPFAPAAFDAILSIDVLCSAGASPALALAEARRRLAPGGLVIMNLPAFRWMMSDHDVRVHNARRYSRREVRALLAESGFRPVSVFYWNSLLFPLMVLRRKVLRSRAARSDVRAYPPLLNQLFSGALALEQRLARLGVHPPFGGSVLAIAVKSDD